MASVDIDVVLSILYMFLVHLMIAVGSMVAEGHSYETTRRIYFRRGFQGRRITGFRCLFDRVFPSPSVS